MPKWWMIKNDDNDNAVINKWLKNNIVSIGFSEIGNPKDYDTKDKLLVRCDKVYNNEAPIFRIRIESLLWKFSREIDINDKIITYSNKDEAYYFATVKNNYVFLPEVSKDEPNIIKVEWTNKSILQANISKEIKNSLSSPSMVYQITNNESEIERIFNDLISNGEEEFEITKDIDLIEKIYSSCEVTVKNLQSNEILKIVDEIFRSNGYIFRNMEENDMMYSIDVIYMDSFKLMKFSSKIIIIKSVKELKVNNVENAIKNNKINENYKLILISLGGFEALAKNNTEIIKLCSLLDANELVKLIFKEYDKFSYGLKRILNLKKVYI
ncbi:hypothetical protein [Clostridium akagii]|uniref:hypothetical protein n=1 Tax=Clostridium akagii TaxID=91623 RepID=UPI000479B15F|nr:hypothetical protein [Clostridium akagii]